METLPSFCSFINNLAYSRGLKGEASHAESSLLKDLEGQPVLFILIDGLGKTLLERLPEDSFLRSLYRRDLLSVFPSTTACAMTTLVSGTPPGIHGTSGRYMYIPACDLPINSMAFRARKDNRPVPLDPLHHAWPYPSWIPEIQGPVYTVIPSVLENSPFARYLGGNTKGEGYSTLDAAFEKILKAASNPKPGGFYYLYLWDLDSQSHETGPESEKTYNLLEKLNNLVENLASKLKKGVKLVITADHGQIQIREENRFYLTSDHPVVSCLKTIPYGEPRATQFLVKPEAIESFRKYFTRDFGPYFDLYTQKETEKLGLFGTTKFSAFAKGNFGNFLALAKDHNLLLYKDKEYPLGIHTGEHGGNSSTERVIPLLVH